ncbi:3-oxoacyl-[acyl-carrier-protein] reductase [Halobacteriovorax marinus]|uniref:3-oxoacyl-[acyl-carrier-protein] reductase n=1 Tax=Halobacteriovorax marinus TaxID=97084 RepID=A0A1Y5FIB3_9BACT|nr:3-oxoacyl-[acyl-carrier-protein] reductase [Halobacteriovorax marinus]
MKGLSTSRVFITGAASGIGRATAQRFYNEGSNLVLVDMPTEEESELKAMFPERMTYLQADVTTKVGLDKIQEQVNLGLDVFINNAGITRDATVHKMTDDQWDQVIAVNLTAIFKLSRMAAIKMKEQKSGVILNAASVVAHYGNFGQTNYTATKAGVIAMTKTMAKELGKDGVRVNAIAPGFIGTPMVRKMPEKVLEMMEGKAPLRRLGEPEDIAAAYAFLASEDASFITGTCLNVDGGVVLG